MVISLKISSIYSTTAIFCLPLKTPFCLPDFHSYRRDNFINFRHANSEGLEKERFYPERILSSGHYALCGTCGGLANFVSNNYTV